MAGRLLKCLIAGLVLGAIAAAVVYSISNMCFHNIAGSQTASPESERGPWCEAIAPDDNWEILPIAAAAMFGAVVALIPGPGWVRAVVWGLGILLLIAVPVIMSQLAYDVVI